MKKDTLDRDRYCLIYRVFRNSTGAYFRTGNKHVEVRLFHYCRVKYHLSNSRKLKATNRISKAKVLIKNKKEETALKEEIQFV